jgi:hypothetical protein
MSSEQKQTYIELADTFDMFMAHKHVPKHVRPAPPSAGSELAVPFIHVVRRGQSSLTVETTSVSVLQVSRPKCDFVEVMCDGRSMDFGGDTLNF